MGKEWRAHLAILGANVIYGLNYSLAKDVMPDHVKPLGFIFIRVIGALLVFWTIHHFSSKERVARKDLWRLALGGLFGVAGNQLFFFSGLNLTTPINAAIIMTSNPVIVLVISALLLRNRISWVKLVGIALGLAGAVGLILSKQEDASFATNTFLGDLFILVNSISYALYLVLMKGMMRKYEPMTVIKWVFAFGFLIVAPIGFPQFMEVSWSTMPTKIWLEVAYVVLGTTVMAYLLNMYGLKKVDPSVVSIYIYLQPVLGATFALWFGMDVIDLPKIIATVLIFAGVYLVSRNPKKATTE